MFARKQGWKRGLAAVAAIVGILLLAACGGGNSSAANANPSASQPAAETSPSSAPQAANGTPVAVTLGETDVSHMFMNLDTTTVPAGPVSFTVVNQGVKKHEFVVLSTDTTASKFPIASFEGEKDRMNEDAEGVENVGETGDMDAGSTKTLTLDLAPGHYALVCNLPGHYRMGMFTDFVVS